MKTTTLYAVQHLLSAATVPFWNNCFLRCSAMIDNHHLNFPPFLMSLKLEIFLYFHFKDKFIIYNKNSHLRLKEASTVNGEEKR